MIFLVLGQVACSERWYEVDPGASDSDMASFMVNGNGSQRTNTASYDGADVSLISEIVTGDSGSTVYFKKSSELFKPQSVVQITDMGVFSADLLGVPAAALGMTEATVAFLDGFSPSTGQRHFALRLDIKAGGGANEYVYVSRPGDYSFDGNSFRVYMTGADGYTIALVTRDLDEEYEETLATNVKFEVYVQDLSGEEIYIGQFAPLAGAG